MATPVHALTAALLCLGLPTAAQAATRAPAAAPTQAIASTHAIAPAGPPVPIGHLRIIGHLRDGSMVRAAGLRWTPGHLPRGDRLLTFEVAYSWRPGADSAVTPFAAQRYIVGHADVGHRLRVTETATEVVETDPVTFSFSVIRVSRSFMTGVQVRPLQRGRRPFTEFTDGLPDRSTASSEEVFQIDPPHYAPADGPVHIAWRLDHGRWRTMPSRPVFGTGLLRHGRHRVTVEVSDRAGHSTLRFAWRVAPLPAPLSCQGTCWYPPHLDRTGHPMRWDWQIGRVAPLQRTGKRAVDIYDIDGFLTTPAEVRAIRTRWQAATLPHPRVACYIDLAWEDYRPDGSVSPGAAPRGVPAMFPAAALGNVYFGFPDERWVDFKRLDALKPMLRERIAMCARKGFNAIEFDDIEVTDNPTGFNLTAGDVQNYLAYAFNLTHSFGLTVLWKNTPDLTWWGVRYADGAVVEECYAFGGCFARDQIGSRQDGITCTKLSGRTPCGWDVFTAFRTAVQPTGKWVGEAEYVEDGYVCNPGQRCRGPHRYAAFCRAVYSPRTGFAAVKFDVNLDGRVFFPCPRGV